MKFRPIILNFLFIGLAVCLEAAPQQVPTLGVSRTPTLAVYANAFGRDINYFREQMTFVNYVNTQGDADVVILFSLQRTGAGGSALTLTFTGQRAFAGMNDTLIIIDEPNDPLAVQQERRVQAFKLILMRYVAHTGLAHQIMINYAGPAAVEQVMVDGVEEVGDPWNSWVFRITGSGRFDKEELEDAYSLAMNLSANRITEAWVMRSSYSYSYSETNRSRKLETGDLEILPSTLSRNQSGSGGLTRTLGSNSGAGVTFNYLSNTRQNIQQRFRLAPAVEYNFYPYRESSRRELTINLSTGLDAVMYDDTTSYGKLEETLLSASLEINFERDASWGSVNVSLEYATYLPAFGLEDALKKNSIGLDGRISLRFSNGISLNLNGGVARINNDLNIVERELDPYERATNTVQLASAFRYDGSISISYTFGSLFNNIVNTRLGSGGGGFGGGGRR